MNFNGIYPIFFDDLTDTKNPENQDINYTISTTPAAVEYSFPLNQPKVVRKLMEIKEPITYIQKAIGEEQSQLYIQQGAELRERFPIIVHYWEFRSVYMNAIQDRRYSLEKRMLFINYMCKTAQSMINDGNESQVPGLVNFFFNKGDRNEIINIFGDVTPQFEYSVVDALALLRSMPSTKEFDEVRNTVFERLGYKLDFSNYSGQFKNCKDKYVEMKKYFYNDYLAQGKANSKEYMLENVMVNYIWTLCMPFADCTSDLWDNFIFFNTIFNALKVLLTVYIDKDNGDEGFVKAVAAFDSSLRSINGAFDGRYVKTTVGIIKKRGFMTPNHMAALSLS